MIQHLHKNSRLCFNRLLHTFTTAKHSTRRAGVGIVCYPPWFKVLRIAFARIDRWASKFASRYLQFSGTKIIPLSRKFGRQSLLRTDFRAKIRDFSLSRVWDSNERQRQPQTYRKLERFINLQPYFAKNNASWRGKNERDLLPSSILNSKKCEAAISSYWRFLPFLSILQDIIARF